jgi:hypothetical protein
MKKFIGILLSLLMIAALAACAKTKQPAADNTAKVPNPIGNVETETDIADALKIEIHAPEGASDVSYSIINLESENDIAQCDYTLDGLKYVLRIEKTSDFADISGVYDDFSTQKDVAVGNLMYILSYNEGGSGLARWYDAASGESHSLYMPEGASEALLLP